MPVTIKTVFTRTMSIHRIVLESAPSYDELRKKIASIYGLNEENVRLGYRDSDNDFVTLGNDEDIEAAIGTLEEQQVLTIFVRELLKERWGKCRSEEKGGKVDGEKTTTTSSSSSSSSGSSETKADEEEKAQDPRLKAVGEFKAGFRELLCRKMMLRRYMMGKFKGEKEMKEGRCSDGCFGGRGRCGHKGGCHFGGRFGKFGGRMMMGMRHCSPPPCYGRREWMRGPFKHREHSLPPFMKIGMRHHSPPPFGPCRPHHGRFGMGRPEFGGHHHHHHHPHHHGFPFGMAPPQFGCWGPRHEEQGAFGKPGKDGFGGFGRFGGHGHCGRHAPFRSPGTAAEKPLGNYALIPSDAHIMPNPIRQNIN